MGHRFKVSFGFKFVRGGASPVGGGAAHESKRCGHESLAKSNNTKKGHRLGKGLIA